jgi:hypothetical protein
MMNERQWRPSLLCKAAHVPTGRTNIGTTFDDLAGFDLGYSSVTVGNLRFAETRAIACTT